MRAAVAISLLLIGAPLRSFAQEPAWYELYDESIKHIQRGEYEQAEAKLLRAQKEGPPSGRGVLRYGAFRTPYFPEYYLGIVYTSTNRPQQAIGQFQRARKAKIDTGNAEFSAIALFEGQAKAALSKATAVKNEPAPPAKPISEAAPPPLKAEAVSPPPTLGDYQKQFADLLATARSQLSQRSFDSAEQTATSARDLAIKSNLATDRPQADALLRQIGGSRFASSVEAALERRDAIGARRDLNVLMAAFPEYGVEVLRERVDGLEREVRSSTLQRSAIRSFYEGKYEQAISQFADAETVAALTPRGHFYRACSLAALAAGSRNPTRDRRLDDARKSYAAAAASASQFRDDLRYISPKVLQLLGIK